MTAAGLPITQGGGRVCCGDGEYDTERAMENSKKPQKNRPCRIVCEAYFLFGNGGVKGSADEKNEDRFV